MSQFGQELSPNDAPALPLWIDGHAYLLMAEQFHSVINAKGDVVRKVPLYGDDAVTIAVGSAEKGLAAWRAMAVEQRELCFTSLHELLARYRGHFCCLLEDEAGLSHELAEAELVQALATIAGRLSELHARTGVVGVTGDSLAPLAAPLSCAADALAAGWAVILKPSPKAPSALFAMAELFSRAGFPAGLVNCVHGDEQAMRALCANPSIALLAFAGSAALGERIAALAAAAAKPYLGGLPDGPLQTRWRALLGYQD